MLAEGGGPPSKVQITNDDAQISKLSCVRLGYFEDDFVRYFVKKPTRRSPLINRGYYSRYAAVRQLMLRFLMAAHGKGRRQILSLGAGYDTTFFSLAKQGVEPELFIEVDCLDVAQRKTAKILETPILRDALGLRDEAETQASDGSSVSAASIERGSIQSPHYRLCAADLRDLEALKRALEEAQFDPGQPTFVLSECVLVYLPPADSQRVLDYLGGVCRCAAVVIYEQINPDDAFGQQMMLNLELRGCPLLGMAQCKDLAAQKERLAACGWSRTEARSLDDIYSSLLDPQDRRRIEMLEIFDEFEEWHLIQQHYCVACGVIDQENLLKDITLWPASHL